LGALILTSGCGHAPKDRTAQETGLSSSLIQTWRGVTFKLKRFEFEGRNRRLLPGAEITLSFGDRDRVEGYSGVNRFFGSYVLQEAGTIRWAGRGFGATRRAGPPALMEQEAQFLRALHYTTQALVSDRLLIFRHPDPAIRLEFEPVK
jgi:heat shock protein HslJ